MSERRKVAIITGSSRGIGASIVERLARDTDARLRRTMPSFAFTSIGQT